MGVGSLLTCQSRDRTQVVRLGSKLFYSLSPFVHPEAQHFGLKMAVVSINHVSARLWAEARHPLLLWGCLLPLFNSPGGLSPSRAEQSLKDLIKLPLSLTGLCARSWVSSKAPFLFWHTERPSSASTCQMVQLEMSPPSLAILTWMTRTCVVLVSTSVLSEGSCPHVAISDAAPPSSSD